jgi:hypothetical protein
MSCEAAGLKTVIFVEEGKILLDWNQSIRAYVCDNATSASGINFAEGPVAGLISATGVQDAPE